MYIYMHVYISFTVLIQILARDMTHADLFKAADIEKQELDMTRGVCTQQDPFKHQ